MDRNIILQKINIVNKMSLSARRAWIEILDAKYRHFPQQSLSARRAWIEILYQLYDTYAKVSLSARRAWIEMMLSVRLLMSFWLVALRKESVDRNFRHKKTLQGFRSRSPQGERG